MGPPRKGEDGAYGREARDAEEVAERGPRDPGAEGEGDFPRPAHEEEPPREPEPGTQPRRVRGHGGPPP